MNVVPQYKVIGPYNYDRIIHNKKNMLRDKWKDAFDFEDQNLFTNGYETIWRTVREYGMFYGCMWQQMDDVKWLCY